MIVNENNHYVARLRSIISNIWSTMNHLRTRYSPGSVAFGMEDCGRGHKAQFISWRNHECCWASKLSSIWNMAYSLQNSKILWGINGWHNALPAQYNTARKPSKHKMHRIAKWKNNRFGSLYGCFVHSYLYNTEIKTVSHIFKPFSYFQMLN